MATLVLSVIFMVLGFAALFAAWLTAGDDASEVGWPLLFSVIFLGLAAWGVKDMVST